MAYPNDRAGAAGGRFINEAGDNVNLADILKSSAGGYGAEYIKDTLEHTPPAGYVYAYLLVIDDAVISAYSPAFDGNSIVGDTLYAPTGIPAALTSITLASGRILAYYGV